MGSYGQLFCFAKIYPDHYKTVENLIEKESLIDDLHLEPQIGHCNIFCDSGDMSISTEKHYPSMLNDAIMMFNKMQCIAERAESVDNRNVFYSPHFHTLMFKCSDKNWEPLFNFYQVANHLFVSYIILTDFEGEAPAIHTKDIFLNSSLSEDYFRCDLDTFLGQPDSNFFYTGVKSPVMESFKVENPYGNHLISKKLNGLQPILGSNCYRRADGYITVF